MSLWQRLLKYIGPSIGALAALSHLLLLAYIIGSRFSYPFDLEWMEGGMLGHALRVMEGKPIYAEPSVDFISYLYTPFYPTLVGWFAKVFGLSYGLGRLVSILSFAVALTIAFLSVCREVGGVKKSWLYGVLAMGLIASSFPHTGAWYDLIRNDSLYLALITSGLFLLRYYHHRWSMVFLAGICLGLGFLTKQTSSLFILFSGAALLILNWRKLPLLVAVVGSIAGGITLLLNHLTDGWYWKYIFKLHQGHDLYWERVWPETELKLLKMAPVVGGVIGLWLIVMIAHILFRRKLLREMRIQSLYWFFLFVVGVAVSAIGFSTQWAVENAYIPGFYFAAIFAAIAVKQMIDGLRSDHYYRKALLAFVFGAAFASQLFYQLYSPKKHLPDPAWKEAGQSLLSTIKSFKGPVLVPYHPIYPYFAGKRSSYHQMGINDVTRAGLAFPKGINQRFEKQYYDAIILDFSPESRSQYSRLLNTYKFERYYRGAEAPGVVTGYKASPRYLFVPKKIPMSTEDKRKRFIFDFEDGSYRGWTIEGKAFGKAPVGGERSNQKMAGPYHGRYLASSLVYGDNQVGSLISDFFVIDRPIMRFSIGGGKDKKRLFCRVIVEGEGEVYRATGINNHIMREVTIDLSNYLNKKAKIELIDKSRGGWGHLLFDALVLETK